MQPIRTKLTALLGIQSPIVVPPMGGGTGGDLAGQVLLAGGYGFVSADYSEVAPFSAELDRARNLLSLPQDAPLPLGTGYLAWILDRDEKKNAVKLLRLALEQRVQSIWLSFGVNLSKWVEYIRRYDQERPEKSKHKTLIWILVNSLAEAQKAVNELKADVLVIQGTEAGGHGHGQALPLISLLPLIVESIPDAPPLVAAGGIANGAQMASVLTMGADGVVIGTRFLATPESIYVFDQARGTTGWPEQVNGRAIPNKTLEEAKEGMDEEWEKRFAEGLKNDDVSRIAVWSGTSIGLVKDIKSAKVRIFVCSIF